MSLGLNYRDTWYEAAMESRENQLADRFADTSPPDQVFKSRDQHIEIALPGFAFLLFPPTQERTCWIYVTHGLSQPLDLNAFQQGFDNGLSGLGCEFVLASPQEEAWPLNVLELLAQYTLKARKLIYPFHRIPATDLMKESSSLQDILGMMEHPHRILAHIARFSDKLRKNLLLF